MSSFKELKSSNITAVPYVANKQWDFIFNKNDHYNNITIHKGIKITSYPFDINIDNGTTQYPSRLIYDSINHLFYRKYTSELDRKSMLNSLHFENLTGDRVIQNNIPYGMIDNFPTDELSEIVVLSIGKHIFGNKILERNFKLKSWSYDIVDDGFGNLFDVMFMSGPYNPDKYINSNIKLRDEVGVVLVGNIFYNSGLVVIANADYLKMFEWSPSDCNPPSRYDLSVNTFLNGYRDRTTNEWVYFYLLPTPEDAYNSYLSYKSLLQSNNVSGWSHYSAGLEEALAIGLTAHDYNNVHVCQTIPNGHFWVKEGVEGYNFTNETGDLIIATVSNGIITDINNYPA